MIFMMCAKAVMFISILTLAIAIDDQMKGWLDSGSVSVDMLINPRKGKTVFYPPLLNRNIWHASKTAGLFSSVHD